MARSTNQETNHSDTAWKVRAWDSAEIQDAFVARGLIAVGDAEMGDLTEFPAKEELAKILRDALPDREERTIQQFCTYWRQFRLEMSIGDVVAVPLLDRRVAIGRIAGDYEYRSAEANPRLRHCRATSWYSTPVSRDVLDEDLHRVVNAPGTIGRIHAPDAARRLAASATR